VGGALALPAERSGRALRISGQRVNFTPWPTKSGKRGKILQPEVLSSSPWDVIDYAIKSNYSARSLQRKACLSFLEQAKAFYFASETQDEAASPLLLYYSFLNLAKCFILFTGTVTNVDDAQHGLSLRRRSAAMTGAVIEAFRASTRYKNIYDLFGQALGLPALSTNKAFRVIKHIIPQIVIGHRLWMSVAKKAPKFVRCEQINFRHNKKQKQIWLRICVNRDDIRSCNLSHAQFSHFAGVQAGYKEIAPSNEELGKRCVVFEQKLPTSYARRPSDVLSDVAASLNSDVWQIVRSIPPYRRYYLNLMSPVDRRIPSLLGVYLFAYYLGSVTRYRPFDFENIKDSRHGMFVAEFIETQGQQFWYQMATEFLEQNVSLPAVLQ
jgi:hypothetical protein